MMPKIPKEKFFEKVKWPEPDSLPAGREPSHPDTIEDEASGPYSHVSDVVETMPLPGMTPTYGVEDPDEQT
jgi:hypothetical protein